MRPAQRSREQGLVYPAHLLPLFLLAVLVLACAWPLAFTDGILARGDTLTYFYPYWHVRNTALLAGRLPLWSPDLFAGVPLLANSQLGTFYPPNWAVAALSPPEGVRLHILAHLVWAAWGAYFLVRRLLDVHCRAGTGAGLVAGAVFALGGAVGAHAEQINQLQGLAWMPWAFLAAHAAFRHWQGLTLLSVVLALQFFTGHTQTVFITAVGLGLMAGASLLQPGMSFRTRLRRVAQSLVILLIAGIVAGGLAVPQVWPTAELSAVSNRSGGLMPNEVTAFSLEPFLIGRSLLPSYDRPTVGEYLSGEYVAYIGVAGLMLAGVAVFARRSSVPNYVRLVGLVLAVVGLFFALGVFNPLYYAVFARLPGFNLFRVPARWLALFALGAALLAAWTWETWRRGELRIGRGRAAALAAALVCLIASALPGVLFSNRLAAAEITYPPQAISIAGWVVAAVITAALLLRAKAGARWAGVAFGGVLALELFAAAHAMPYHDLAPPETFSAGRFTQYQLAALNADQPVPGRSLAVSGLFFDPGDLAALEARYAAEGVSPSSVRTALVAAKLYELLGANLNLLFGLPSVDGYDGGVLPTRYYTAFTAAMLPPGEDGMDDRAVDGRLRERLVSQRCGGACIPDMRWLDMLNVEYLILDKTYDLWSDGIAYDTGLPAQVTPQRAESPAINAVYRAPAPFPTTAVDLLIACPEAPVPCWRPTLGITDADGQTVQLTGERVDGNAAMLDRYHRVRVSLSEPARVATVFAFYPEDAPPEGAITLRAATLVDERTAAADGTGAVFLQLAPAPWSRVLSSDIKLYQRDQTVMLPRAYGVSATAAEWVTDDRTGDEAALARMGQPGFDPARGLVLSGTLDDQTQPAANAPGVFTAAITEYTPERVQIDVQADAPGWLVLSDAYYPGWQATVNGSPVPITRANVLFRAVPVSAGSSTVVFTYAPVWQGTSLLIGGIAWAAVLLAAAVSLFGTRRGRD